MHDLTNINNICIIILIYRYIRYGNITISEVRVMIRNNLITFLCHIGIIIVSSLFFYFSRYFQPYDIYFELIVTLIGSLAYYMLGTRLKRTDNNKINFFSTSVITLLSFIMWLCSFIYALNAYGVLSISDLPFRRYGVLFAFNSPFIPVIDLMTSNVILKSKLYGILWLFVGFIPQFLILLGMLWDKKAIKRRIKVLIFASGIICLFIIFSTIQYKVYGIDKDNIVGNTSGNLNYEGLMSVQGNWIYYTKTSRLFVLSKSELYKTKINGRKETELYYGLTTYINVIGKWIYFIDENNGNECYRISVDGGDAYLLTDDSISYMVVYSNYIYYKNDSDGGKLYRMDCSGGKKTKLSDDEANSITIENGFIYYCNENGIVKMKMDAYEKQFVYKDSIKSFVINNNSILFLNNKNALGIIDINSGGVIDLDIHDISEYNISNNLVFYNYHPGSDIYIIDFNGKEKGYKGIRGADYFYILNDSIFFIYPVRNHRHIY